MISVALIGPDGAGKSTITELLEREPLPAPVTRIYMGVNLEASGLMLPTTRLAMALKARRGHRPDMTGPGLPRPPITGGPAKRTFKAGARGVRLVLWLAEEWFRQIVAEYHRRRGRIVLFDRHFYADYYHFDVATEDRRPVSSRLHGWLLKNVYPKPDLVICLDAPGQVLFDRKGEASPEWLEGRRRQYLQLSAVIPDFVVVDVNRPLDVVTREVATVVSEFYLKRKKRP